MLKRALGTCALTAVLAVSASAATIYTPLGTGPRPVTLGPYAMTSFGDDDPGGDTVTAIASPLGPLTFDSIGGDVDHYFGIGGNVGTGGGVDFWATWNASYAGDVYGINSIPLPFDWGALALVVLDLPADTGAFYFYAAPDDGVHPIFVFATGAAPVSMSVDGNGGATGFGFHNGTSPISNVVVVSDADFAVGEFGIARLGDLSAVPEPASLFLFGSGIVGLAARARRRRSSR